MSSNVGGICERYQNIQGQLKSLNSGIVTVINYGTRVPDLVSHITFSHEVGKLFESFKSLHFIFT